MICVPIMSAFILTNLVMIGVGLVSAQILMIILLCICESITEFAKPEILNFLIYIAKDYLLHAELQSCSRKLNCIL